MLNHVKIKHTEEFKDLENETLREISQTREPIASTSSSQSNAIKIQQTIFESFTTKWNIADSRAKEIHKAVAEMIAVDNQPISMLENNGFHRLMDTLKPKYQIPSRKYMSDVVIPEVYTKVKNVIKAELAKAISRVFWQNRISACFYENELMTQIILIFSALLSGKTA